MSIIVPIEEKKLFNAWKVEELKGVILAQARCLGARCLVSEDDKMGSKAKNISSSIYFAAEI
ncbi:hypothetical protein BpHYR1_027592 [Brachionus plicatilis]|uniref:Uncharacterized protein n=1 Tax=Brachionus plicatilis TaxID=10195 RepID=A0A3M7PJ44_BRAPC|nr:hypothetical protein BpHYR1_027592 [Brachionus plicatilis]